MDSEKFGSIKIDKLTDSNFHIWKQKIDLILTYREVDEVASQDNPHKSGTPEFKKWTQLDKQARALIGLSLSDEMLEHVRGASTAKQMLDDIHNVFQRHTLLNKLRARRNFYTVEMRAGERMLSYINRVQHLGSILKSMNVDIDGQEMAMAILNGLPEQYENIITALDALGDDIKTFTLDLVKSRLLQEEQRRDMRHHVEGHTSSAAALFGSSSRHQPSGTALFKCSFCKRKGHNEDRCWDKHPALKPKHLRNRGKDNNKQLFVAEGSNTTEGTSPEEEEAVCLISQNCNSAYAFEKSETSIDNASSLLWYIDSGASSHMTPDLSAFSTLEKTSPFSVQMGDKSIVSVEGRGDVELFITISGRPVKCRLQQVLYVPSLQYSLVSVSTLSKRSMQAVFNSSGVSITKNGKLCATGTLSGNLYILDTYRAYDPLVACIADINRWHERLGHVFHEGIKVMSTRNAVTGLQISDSAVTSTCSSCVAGKLTRSKIPKSASTSDHNVLDIVHSDVCGPMEINSKGGARYFVTFIDRASRWTTVYPISSKDEAFPRFKQFLALAERQTGRKLKALHTDGGGEYISKEFSDFLASYGIARRKTCVDTPQQNGVAERMNRTLLDMVRAMLSHKKVPKEFWADAVVTAAYLRNRVTCRGLPSNTTPFQAWYGAKPDLKHIRIFGSRCWYHNRKAVSKKLGDRGTPAMLIGYSQNQKAYKLWDFNSQNVIISRDVRFDESDNCANDIAQSSLQPEPSFNKDIILHYSPDTKPSMLSQPVANSTPIEETSPEVPEATDEAPPTATSTEPTALRKSTRDRRTPGEWWKAPAALIASVSDIDLSYHQAIKGEEKHMWIAAIESELNSIRKNKTWILVPRHQAKNILSSRWVFRKKNMPGPHGGQTVKHKARLVTRGFQQKYGIDYEETFAPVVKFSTLRLFLALVAAENLELHQMDVKTAFLNGELEEEIFMEQPEGCEDKSHPDFVCKLLKALYGLKQAPRQWFAKINAFFCELGFESCAYDPCFYVKRSEGSVIMITLYVDDLLIAGSSIAAVQSLKSKLADRFEMEDCDEAKVCLGLEISRNRDIRLLKLSQTEYAKKVLQRFEMANCKAVSTPMEHQFENASLTDSPVDQTLYRQAIGSLMYLMVCTRPDICFVVGRLSQFMEKPTKSLWTAVKRVFRYIAGTLSTGIVYTGDQKGPVNLVGFSDSDWAGCKIDRKSTTGFVFFVAGGAVSWKSKKQSVVTTSTAEAEYLAMGSAAQECIWISRLFNFASGRSTLQPEVYVDNQGSIKMAKNDASGNRTKHIDIKYHLVRDLLNEGKFKLSYCPSNDMVADILTKPLAKVLFQKHYSSLGLQNA